jgi:catechol 2,3-dioxygenase-like lactoylglutathione lyase family enzyme
MDVQTVSIGVPVRDLDEAVGWYQRALELGEPDLVPIEGLAEFDLGGFWLQLTVSPDTAGGEGIALTFSVKDAAREHGRLTDLGLTVTELERVEGTVEFFELVDPDGNRIGFVAELE